MSAAFQPIAARPAPIPTEGFVPWVRRNLFGDWKSAVTTIVIALLAVAYLPEIANWALVKAVFRANLADCQAARGSGACDPPGRYSSTPFTFPSARRRSMIFWAMCGGTGS